MVQVWLHKNLARLLSSFMRKLHKDEFLMYSKIPDVQIKQIQTDCLNMEPFTSYSGVSGEQ